MAASGHTSHSSDWSSPTDKPLRSAERRLASHLLHDGHRALANERDRHWMGANPVARDQRAAWDGLRRTGDQHGEKQAQHPALRLTCRTRRVSA